MSPSSRGRGLKSCHLLPRACLSESPSSRGRGLKYSCRKGRGKIGKSPSSRGRGLKSATAVNTTDAINVALFTRAWIEILRPLRRKERCIVALFTRAWIEIKCGNDIYQQIPVALFTRAWIEIERNQGHIESGNLSPSSRGRGLKSEKEDSEAMRTGSPSSRGRGLKF